MGDITLYIIRHGETNRNLNANLIGQSPEEPLSLTGEQQAEALGQYFADHLIDFDKVFVSPYLRAKQTAQIVLKHVDKSLDDCQIVDELREYSVGDALDQPRDKYATPELIKKMEFEGMNFKYQNGESLYEVEERIGGWVKTNILNNSDYINSTKNFRIALFSHCVAIKCLLHYIMQFNHKLTWRLKIDNTSCSIVEYKNFNWFIKHINDIRHLQNM